MNPVLQRELTERWRSRRAPVTLTLYLGVLGGVLLLLYQIARSVLNAPFGMGGRLDAAAAGPVLGRFLLEGLLFTVMLLVLFVAPAYAAAQLTGERERRTLPLLQVTLLRPWQIAAGKLGSATAWLLLLIVAALPLGAGAFFLGGASLTDLLRGIVFILVVAVGIAGMALGISAVARRTTGAVVLTYGLVLALVGGTGVAAAAEAIFEARDGRFDRANPPLALYANPFYGLADAAGAGTAGAFSGGFLPSPLAIIGHALPQPEFPDDGSFAEAITMEAQPFPMDGMPARRVVASEPGLGAGPGDPPAREPVWLKVMAVYLALGAAGFAVATRRLSSADASPPRRGRRGRGRRGGRPAEAPR